MNQQSFFAACADTGYLVKWRGGDRFAALGAMRADSKAVRLVAQSLDEIQHWIIVPQRERALAEAVEFLFALVAVNPFRNADNWQVFDTKIAHYFGYSADLSRTAIY